jgi:hypothetical protein
MSLIMIGTVILIALVLLYLVIIASLVIGYAVEHRQGLNAFLKAWDDNDFYVVAQTPWDGDNYVEIRFKDGLAERKLTVDYEGNPTSKIHWSDSDRASNRKAGRRERQDLTKYTA